MGDELLHCGHSPPAGLGSLQHSPPPSFDEDGPSLSQVTLQTLTTLLWDVQSPPFLPT